MASPDLVNMMAFIKNGSSYPKSLDPKGKKGIVSTESLVGYSRYTSRENANDNQKQEMDYSPGGYYKYSTERTGATKTYTHEGWIESKQAMTQFRNYVAKNFQDEDKIAWLPVQSFKDYATASQYGLFNAEDYAQITKNTLNRFFKHVGLEPTNMIWWMNYHNNKNHPHVHLVFLEKNVTREKGTFTIGELKEFKRYMLTEMKERERLILGTDMAFKQNMKLLQSSKQLLQNKGMTIISSKQDKQIEDSIQKLFDKLPSSGRLQYGSSNMIPYREEIDNIVTMVLEHEYVKEDFENLMQNFRELDSVYEGHLNEKVTNMQDSEKLKIRKVIANNILSNFKSHKSNSTNVIDNEVQLNSNQDIDAQEPKESFNDLSDDELNDVSIIDEANPPDDYIFINEDNRIPHINWSPKYKDALTLLYKPKRTVHELEKAELLLTQEAGELNVLAINDLAKVYGNRHDDQSLKLSNEKYTEALKGFESILASTNEKGGWMAEYLNYRIGKYYMYGNGTEIDYLKARTHLSLASSNKFALYSLGTLYERGYGGDVDIDTAKTLYQKSSDLGNPYATYSLAKHIENEDIESSKRLYEIALHGFKEYLKDTEDDALQYKIARIILDEKTVGVDKKEGLDYLIKSTELGNIHTKRFFIKYVEKNNLSNLEHLATKYKNELLQAKDENILNYEGSRLLKSVEREDIYLGISYLSSIEDYQSDKNITYKLYKGYTSAHELGQALRYLELSAELGNVYGAYKYAELMKDSNSEVSSVYYLKSFELMEQEIELKNNVPFFKFRIAQMYEKGLGVDKDKKLAKNMYKSLAHEGHDYATTKYIYMNLKDKNYFEYLTMQKFLMARVKKGDHESAKTMAFMYLDKDSPVFSKERGVEMLQQVYNETLDLKVKESIDYYSNDYTKSNTNNFSNAKSSINSALAAIKRSDAEVKRIVRQGLDDYLETEKEREQQKYGKIF
ncbi:SEL1-like repeat protein [Erysipelothrix aquatica]|uniref:SEL1-like repeat protein n=1 Tax=Erysipelothrix aquatica TaxID=2683714 RepID=UPI00135CAA50|nr:SEL1-like repeat protein [Erysipelothrix aquatica]